MTFVLAVVVFPLLLAALSVGVGLLVQRISGLRIPAVLLAPLGFAGVVGIVQAATWSRAIAPATPAILVAAALAGVATTWRSTAARWHARRAGWWWGLAPAPAAYVTTAAPVLLAGHVTFPGYLLDTTGAIQLMGAERLLSHGRAFTMPGSAYGLSLHNFYATGYPTGGQGALGAVGRLVGVDPLWLYAPFMAVMLAFAALALGFLARRAGLARPAAAVTGLVAAVPALVYAYALQGSIKEIALLPTLLALGALIVLARELLAAGPRGVLPLGVVGAAGWSTIGLAFTPWLALGALAGLLLGADALGRDRRARLRAVAMRTAVLGVTLVLLAAPTVATLRTTLHLAVNVTNANAHAVSDPGNLLRPLPKVQALGIWLGASHRTDPGDLLETYMLIGVVLVAIVLGLVWLVRRRQWAVLAVIAVYAVVWLVLTPESTTWTAAKLLVLISPVALLVACIGAFGRLGARRLDGLALGAAIVLGVLGSDAIQYHHTTLANTARFEELRHVGERFAGDRPTLTPDFDEYALYLLRDMAPDGPGNAFRVQPWTMGGGARTLYGHTYDLDELSIALVDRFTTIVVRRSAFKSRPPGAFRLAWRGAYYEVWRRAPGAPAARARLALGDAHQPAGVPACRRVGAFAAASHRSGAGRLRFAPRPANAVAMLARTQRTPLAVLQADGSIAFTGPGTVLARLVVPSAGAYRVWLEGDAGRALRATVDGRPVGALRNQSGGDGNVLRFDALTLRAGRHTVSIRRGGGSLAPGDAAPTLVRALALAPLAAEREPVRSVPLAAWRTLCGQRLDWIEAL
jgi:hypothetical protein